VATANHGDPKSEEAEAAGRSRKRTYRRHKEEGKHRRNESCLQDRLIANLHVWHVSAGHGRLTTVLAGDILAFGFKIDGKDRALFEWQGWLVGVACDRLPARARLGRGFPSRA
jgi:hypothetical protein